ncbi:MAG: hypothetical protein ACREMB_25645 [Candidatus Rokuibacteriota bacterium]
MSLDLVVRGLELAVIGGLGILLLLALPGVVESARHRRRERKAGSPPPPSHLGTL